MECKNLLISSEGSEEDPFPLPSKELKGRDVKQSRVY
jgi:hypothetical protein